MTAFTLVAPALLAASTPIASQSASSILLQALTLVAALTIASLLALAPRAAMTATLRVTSIWTPASPPLPALAASSFPFLAAARPTTMALLGARTVSSFPLLAIALLAAATLLLRYAIAPLSRLATAAAPWKRLPHDWYPAESAAGKPRLFVSAVYHARVQKKEATWSHIFFVWDEPRNVVGISFLI